MNKKILGGFRDNRREKVTGTKDEAENALRTNNDADETPKPPISAGRASRVLEILSKFTLHNLEIPSRTVLSYFSERTG